jgi:2-dehydropantoate 2-reductase
MRIAIMGAGGVGGYFGARLQAAGHEVAFIARGRHLEALQSSGLAVKSALGDAQLKVRAVEKPAEAGPADVVLFAVKLWDTEAAAEALRPVLASGGVVIPFQNGVESIERLAKILGPERVLGGSAYIATRIASPGVIEHTGNFARLLFGPVMASQRAAAEAFLAACKSAGIEATVSDDIVRVNWEKFVYLVGISGVCCVARAPLGVVCRDRDLRWLLDRAFRETWQVGIARGIALTDEFLGRMLPQADSFPGEMKPSMLGDLEAGGRLEAPWLCGAVVRMAAEAHLDVPANRAIYAALKPYLNGRT